MIARLVKLFVAEPLPVAPGTAGEVDASRWVPPGEAPAPALVVVLAAGGCAAAAGAAIGLALADAHDAGTAVVCSWAPDDDVPEADPGTAPAPVLATPAARRLARGLQGRELAAVARGRLVALRLPAGAADAARAAGRAAAVGSPVVLVVAGPRPPAFDALVGEAGRVVVATPPGAPEALVELALADAARAGRATGHLVVASSLARALAPAGVVLPPAVRRAAAEVLG